MAAPVFAAFGETLTAREWSQHPRCAVPYGTLDWRLRKGWDPETALTAPPKTVRRGVATLAAYGETKPVAAWLDDPRCVVSINTLKQRLDGGWTPEAALTTPAGIGQSRRGMPLTERHAGELRAAAERVRSGPRVHRHTPADAPEAAALRERNTLILAALGRGTTLSEIGRTVGLSGTQVAVIRDGAS